MSCRAAKGREREPFDNAWHDVETFSYCQHLPLDVHAVVPADGGRELVCLQRHRTRLHDLRPHHGHRAIQVRAMHIRGASASMLMMTHRRSRACGQWLLTGCRGSQIICSNAC